MTFKNSDLIKICLLILSLVLIVGLSSCNNINDKELIIKNNTSNMDNVSNITNLDSLVDTNNKWNSSNLPDEEKIENNSIKINATSKLKQNIVIINNLEYKFIEKFNKECKQDYECTLTSEYVHKSDCDYQPKCYSGTCAIICSNDFVSKEEKLSRIEVNDYIKSTYPIKEFELKFENFNKGNCKTCYNIDAEVKSDTFNTKLKFEIYDNRIISTKNLNKVEYIVSNEDCNEQDGHIVNDKSTCSNLELGIQVELELNDGTINSDKICCVPMDIDILKSNAYEYATESKECTAMGDFTNESTFNRALKTWDIKIEPYENISCDYYCNILENRTGVLKQTC